MNTKGESVLNQVFRGLVPMLSRLEDGAGGQFLIKLQKKGKEIQNLYIGYVREWDKNSLLQLTPEVIKGNSLRWENMGRPSRSPKEWDQKLQRVW